MEVSHLPLNKKTTVIAEKFLLAVANRISKDEAVITYIDLKNRQEVLRILQKIKDNTQILQYVDSDYWKIFADGNRLSKYDFSLFKNVKTKIKANTANRSLEIASF